ncbi:MAG TPA: HAMP domain-containing protein, partial [Acidimicrobiales bacterium]|nr:HAMP domain-containing protein [Acidimicrobiales bacterium]
MTTSRGAGALMVTPWKRVACWLCRRTSHRLVACLAVVVVLLAVPTAVSILGQRSQQQVASESPVLLGLSGDISEMRFLDADIAGWQTGYMTDVTTIGGKAATAPTDQSRAAFLADEASIDKQLRALRADPFTTPERADLSGLAGKWRTFFAADAKMVQILRSRGAAGLPAANAIASGAETDVFYAVLSDCDKALASVDARAAASARQVNSTASSNEVLAAAIFAAVLALVVLLARVLVRSITRPVGELNSTLASMSAGDLTVRAEVGSSDEFGELAAGLNKAIEAQESAVLQVATSSEADARAAADYAAAGEVLTALNSGESIAEIRRIFIDKMTAAFGLTYACFYRIGADNRYESHEEGGPAAAALHVGLAAAEGLLADAARRREIVFVPDTRTEQKDPRVASAVRAGAAGAAFLPIMMDGAARGMVELFFAEPLDARRQQAIAEMPASISGHGRRIDAQDQERREQAELAEKVDELLAVVDAASKGDLTREVGVAG